jgi:hypothetical protein
VAKKNGNGEGGITRHKKSGLYMARYTVQTRTGPKRKTCRRLRRPRWMDGHLNRQGPSATGRTPLT